MKMVSACVSVDRSEYFKSIQPVVDKNSSVLGASLGLILLNSNDLSTSIERLSNHTTNQGSFIPFS
jgi:hypothetical protein